MIHVTHQDGPSGSMIFDGPFGLLLGDVRVDMKELTTRPWKPSITVYDIQNTTAIVAIHTLPNCPREALQQHHLDKRKGESDSLSTILECHIDDEEINYIADILVRLSGIPKQPYAEAVIVTEYHRRKMQRREPPPMSLGTRKQRISNSFKVASESASLL